MHKMYGGEQFRNEDLLQLRKEDPSSFRCQRGYSEGVLAEG